MDSVQKRLGPSRANTQKIGMRRRKEQTCRLQWAFMLFCVVTRAAISSLLELHRPHDGETSLLSPSHSGSNARGWIDSGFVSFVVSEKSNRGNKRTFSSFRLSPHVVSSRTNLSTQLNGASKKWEHVS